MNKTCNSCLNLYPEETFIWSKRDGYGTKCKPCAAHYSKERRKDLGYVYKQKAKKYNTDIETIEKLFAENTSCQICGLKGRRELCVDHCHSTGAVRGLLCDNCNKAIGLFKDSHELLLKAVTYLEESK